jgi:hypothetical protein
MLHDYSACQVQLSADTLATATSASDLTSPASVDVRRATEKGDERAAPEVEHGDFPSAQPISYRDIGRWSSGKI